MSSPHSISSNLPKLTTPRSGWLFSYVAGFPMLHTQSFPTRKSQSIDTPVLRPSVAHCDALRDDFDWQSIRMCLAAAPEAHRPALRVSGWFLTFPLANGAGRFTFWRRCVIWDGTCAANRPYLLSIGAGPHPLSSPAPTSPHTCANNHGHLRQIPTSTHPYLPTLPLRQTAARGYPIEPPRRPSAVRQCPITGVRTPRPASGCVQWAQWCGYLAKMLKRECQKWESQSEEAKGYKAEMIISSATSSGDRPSVSMMTWAVSS